MDFDDLKDAWKETGSKLSKHNADEAEKLLKLISTSRRSIGRNFKIEIFVGALMYLSFILAVLIFGSKIQPFLYKLVIVTLIFTLPIYYRMFRSLVFLRRLDYSKDIKANLYEFLLHYKTSIQFYRWGTYFLIVILLVLFFNDASFLALEKIYQAAITGYLVLVAIIIGPVVSSVYGKRVREIQSLLNED